MNLQRKKSICVYCAHRDGAKPSYLQAAQDTGEMIARLNMRLVYGAGSVGLMGKVANSAQSGNAEVFGVIPEHLLDLEIGKDDIDSFIVTENMHERKKIMVLNSDAFILLPGGFGSLDEFFELITWRQLGLHNKPCFIFNVNGYWNPLLKLIDNQISEGFVLSNNKSFFSVVESIDELESKLIQSLS